MSREFDTFGYFRGITRLRSAMSVLRSGVSISASNGK
tara:strand:+ start:20335 stop:20445 length:111 start_codon:yes stop_codon:yes gene_type:complete